MKKKIIEITPIVCLMAYLLLGFTVGGKAWGVGICIFLICPIMPYLLGKRKFVLTAPIAVTAIYVVMCWVGMAFGASLWHPGWIIFLLIPIIEIIKSPSKDNKETKKKNSYEDDDDDVYEAK